MNKAAAKSLTEEERASQEAAQRHAMALQQRRAAMRLLKARQARDSLITFTEFTMPDIEDPEDAEKTRYDAQYFHKALAAALEEVEKGQILRLIITFPPRHGKSELTSRRLPAYLLGKDPYRHIIFATYNQPFAEDFGRNVRQIVNSNAYKTVFPNTVLAKGSQAADRLATEEGGLCVFVGRGGSSTGRGADVLIIDDPLKDRQEADSATTREELWNWYNDTMSTRLMSDTGAIIIIQTRWHEDDLIGRLTDPTNPCFNADEAAQWKIINIPAIADEDDILGRPKGAPLWPGRFGLEYLESFRRRNPRGFSALYQQKPTPDDGDFFQSHMITTYRREDLPKSLRIYAASDHAVGVKQANDRTCLLIIGIDERNVIWVLDAWWKRAKTDSVVDAMINLMIKWKPLVWWAERGHISASIGPFLFRLMREKKVYINVVEQTPVADKVTRAQSIQGRMSMGMVRFPSFEPWFEDAKQEMLKFPQARHDDFVDALAHVGLGLERLIKAPTTEEKKSDAPAVGTLGWVKADAKFRSRQSKLALMMRGM